MGICEPTQAVASRTWTKSTLSCSPIANMGRMVPGDYRAGRACVHPCNFCYPQTSLILLRLSNFLPLTVYNSRIAALKEFKVDS